MPEYMVVYRDLHSLWEREVFDPFRHWPDEQFNGGLFFSTGQEAFQD
jgi:hypothetical protein